jgi:TonB family protein
MWTLAQNSFEPAPASAKTFETGAEALTEFKPAEIVSNPHPHIPAHLHDECYNSCCLARFTIASDGKAKVRLLTSSGSDEIDDITLSTLRLWKFRPAMLDGKPVGSTRRLRVEFEIN